jgi:hypothetical protein
LWSNGSNDESRLLAEPVNLSRRAASASGWFPNNCSIVISITQSNAARVYGPRTENRDGSEDVVDPQKTLSPRRYRGVRLRRRLSLSGVRAVFQRKPRRTMAVQQNGVDHDHLHQDWSRRIRGP